MSRLTALASLSFLTTVGATAMAAPSLALGTGMLSRRITLNLKTWAGSSLSGTRWSSCHGRRIRHECNSGGYSGTVVPGRVRR